LWLRRPSLFAENLSALVMFSGLPLKLSTLRSGGARGPAYTCQYNVCASRSAAVDSFAREPAAF
jgi:hypothetical protein